VNGRQFEGIRGREEELGKGVRASGKGIDGMTVMKIVYFRP